MAIFENIPEFDYTLDDRVLQLGIFIEPYETIEEGDSVTVELDVPVCTFEYGWSTYEEGENTQHIIDAAALTIQTVSSGNSCEGGDWDTDDTQQFDSWEELFKSITEDILDYYGEL